MHRPMPPLRALQAFEAVARHLSMTKAAQELHVTPGALSHRIREALEDLDAVTDPRILVVSTSPGLTAKWLAPRLYRFSAAHPDVDVRISSSLNNANFASDGVDLAVRNMRTEPAFDPALEVEKLIDISYIPVRSPGLIRKHGPVRNARDLARLPLIHDETLSARSASPEWSEWFRAAGVDGVDLRRGLRFNSADHALDAAGEGAGVLLTHDLLAYDELRTGRLIIPVMFALTSGRAFYLVWAKGRKQRPAAQAFCRWIKEEVAALDWRRIRRGRAGVRSVRPPSSGG